MAGKVLESRRDVNVDALMVDQSSKLAGVTSTKHHRDRPTASRTSIAMCHFYYHYCFIPLGSITTCFVLICMLDITIQLKATLTTRSGMIMTNLISVASSGLAYSESVPATTQRAPTCGTQAQPHPLALRRKSLRTARPLCARTQPGGAPAPGQVHPSASGTTFRGGGDGGSPSGSEGESTTTGNKIGGGSGASRACNGCERRVRGVVTW